MFYQKRLNNNVVVAVDQSGDEKILMGKGLGFQMVVGARVDDRLVEKVFSLSDAKMNDRLKELLATVPAEHVQLADEIIGYAKTCVGGTVSENVLIALCDHIYMAVERKKQGIEVKNVLLWDIQKFHRREYEVGVYAVKRIHEFFGVELSPDEAGFIALHIVNAQLDLHTETVRDITVVMQEIETIVRMTFSLTLDVHSVYYDRFVAHLKFFAARIFSGKTYDGQDVVEFMAVVKRKYPEAYRCAQKVADFLKKRYGHTLSEEELLYLSIHISRIVQVSH